MNKQKKTKCTVNSVVCQREHVMNRWDRQNKRVKREERDKR